MIVICAVACHSTLPYVSIRLRPGQAVLNKLVEMCATEATVHDVRVFAVVPGFAVTQVGEHTYNHRDARRYLLHMLQYLEE